MLPTAISSALSPRTASGNQIRTEADHEDNLDFTHTNPAAGPLYIDGAEAGDVLAADILDIQVADQGVMMTLEGYGALWPTVRSGPRSFPSGTAARISMM